VTGTITTITRQKRDKARASIFIEGGFAFGLEEQTIEKFRLRKGDYIDDDQYAEIIAFDYTISAKRIAQRYLNHRARSEREVRLRLEREEIPEAIIDNVVETLKQYSMIDDVLWAKAYVNDRLLRKQVSSSEIARELKHHRISNEIIESTLATLSEAETDIDRAKKAAGKCWARYAKLPPEERKHKFYSYLLRRGFSVEVISPVYADLTLSCYQDTVDMLDHLSE
jgi:regulatory protein